MASAADSLGRWIRKAGQVARTALSSCPSMPEDAANRHSRPPIDSPIRKSGSRGNLSLQEWHTWHRSSASSSKSVTRAKSPSLWPCPTASIWRLEIREARRRLGRQGCQSGSAEGGGARHLTWQGDDKAPLREEKCQLGGCRIGPVAVQAMLVDKDSFPSRPRRRQHEPHED